MLVSVSGVRESLTVISATGTGPFSLASALVLSGALGVNFDGHVILEFNQSTDVEGIVCL